MKMKNNQMKTKLLTFLLAFIMEFGLDWRKSTRYDWLVEFQGASWS